MKVVAGAELLRIGQFRIDARTGTIDQRRRGHRR